MLYVVKIVERSRSEWAVNIILVVLSAVVIFATRRVAVPLLMPTVTAVEQPSHSASRQNSSAASCGIHNDGDWFSICRTGIRLGAF